MSGPSAGGLAVLSPAPHARFWGRNPRSKICMLHQPNGEVGTLNSMSVGIAFTLWCLSKQTPVEAKDIMERFGVSRATAFRWRRAWLDQVAKWGGR